MLPPTPPRNAAMRVKPAGTEVPSASLATRWLVSNPVDGLVDITGGQQ